jgi:hypothetical protein
MSDDQNPWAMAARKAKAEALAEVLRAFKATPEAVEAMDEEGWRAAAALADVRWGDSKDDHQTTKAMVIGALSMTPTARGRL